MLDLRFPTSLQMMLMLAAAAEAKSERVSSLALAESLGANPSFVRQLIVPLSAAKLIETTQGRSGGVRLVRAADAITLREIYSASVGDKCVWASREVPQRCLVSNNMRGCLAGRTGKVQGAMLAVLQDTTLADSLEEMHALEKKRVRRAVSASSQTGNKTKGNKG